MIIKLSDFERIKPFRLNRKGHDIGHIVRWNKDRKLYYLTHRTGEHYYIKGKGYAIQRDIINKLIRDQNVVGVIIHYRGSRDKKWLISNIMDWFNGKTIEYSKDTGKAFESYGKQKVLSEKKMIKIGVDSDDISKVQKRGLQKF